MERENKRVKTTTEATTTTTTDDEPSSTTIDDDNVDRSDLVLVGKIVDNPSFRGSSSGRMVIVNVQTWMTDLDRVSPWYVQVLNGNSSDNPFFYKALVKCIPLRVDDTSYNVVGVRKNNEQEGRLQVDIIRIVLERIVGCSSADFYKVWNFENPNPNYKVRGTSAVVEMLRRKERLAYAFKDAKIFISREQVLGTHRRWLESK